MNVLYTIVQRKFYRAAPPPFYTGDISSAYKASCTETIIKTSHKKFSEGKQASACRDGSLKNQPN